MASTSTAEEKAALRALISARSALWTAEELRRSDDALFSRFLALPALERAGTVLLFSGMGTEPDTARLIPALLSRGKTVALPRCLPHREMEARVWNGASPLVRHPYGMLEPGEDCPPLPPEALDLILVPAVCYDRRCGRLGRGGGFYDRYLARTGAVTVGLCRGALLQDSIPREEHDLGVDLVLTETAAYEARPPEGGPAPFPTSC